MEEIFELSANIVTIEVTDEKTDRLFRRELPIDYYENANCLRLRGENLDGSMSELVFFTGRGLERLRDTTGLGADHDGCGEHK